MKDEIKEILSLLNSSSWSNEAKQIEDCITNLQNTNKNHSKKLIELGDKITNLQEENRILKENAKHNDKVVDKARWNELIYKSKIKKAIEVLKNTMYPDIAKAKALNILQGDDKE